MSEQLKLNWNGDLKELVSACSLIILECLFFVLFADLEQDGFSKNPFFHGIIAEVPEQHKNKNGESRKQN